MSEKWKYQVVQRFLRIVGDSYVMESEEKIAGRVIWT